MTRSFSGESQRILRRLQKQIQVFITDYDYAGDLILVSLVIDFRIFRFAVTTQYHGQQT